MIFFKISEISYTQHENICQRKIDKEKQIEENRIRTEELGKVCPYVDCNSLQAKHLCTEECIGSKLEINKTLFSDRKLC